MKRLLLIVASLFVYLGVIAQVPPQLPLDPKVKSGKLDNGLTYFIMKNAEPKGQAEFFIAQKVGAILENDKQRGLAHFLEHMAFNGTKNFPDNKVISYLETIGVKFGANLNAYTAVDQTVYNISAVPVTRQGIIDSCLLILHDWACAINLNEKDIDKERGVIREELRTRSNAQMRMIEAILPEIMPGSKYAHRLPAGLVEVIDNFTYSELREYYKKWYRPDLQGIIVVGDIDPEAIEKQIIKLFGAIPKAVNPAPREIFEVPNTKEPLISVASDVEATSSSIMLMYKHDVLPKEFRPTAVSLVYGYMNSMVTSMLNSRLSEIAQKANSPFTSASSNYGDFITSNTKSTFGISAGAREGELETAFKAIVEEAEKVKRFGFTASEYERAKANFNSRLEQIYKEREKLNSGFYIDQILNHFLTGEAMPGVEMEYTLMQQIIPSIPIEQLNTYAKSLPVEENVVVAVMMPKKEGLAIPTKEALLDVYNKTRASQIEAYKETVSNEPLISKAPVAGKIVSEVNDAMSNSIVWTLSNGATVVIKKTDFKEDQILFNASSRGGFSLFDIKDNINTKVISEVASVGGFGNFSATDLRKVLAGKNVNLQTAITLTTEALNGSSAPKDIETFMQLVYLNFTSLRSDPEAYQALLGRMRAQLKNAAANPMTAFTDTLQATLYNNSPYAKRLSVEMLDKIDYARTLELAKGRFANAADFTFVFVGNVDAVTLRPLVETYIASLPGSKGKKEDWKNVGMVPVKGKVVKHFDREMQTPKATVYTIFSGKTPYSVENLIMSNMTKQVFEQVFTRTIREEEQGTYGVGVNMSLSTYPTENFTFLFGFDTDVALKERLLARAHKEIANVIQNGVTTEDFNKIIEFMNKNYTQNLRENSYWLNTISNRYLIGKDLHTTYEAALKAMTPAKLHEYIKSVLSQGNQFEIIMKGFAPESK
ncbi:MAG TPA: peptidase M16 [Rikenellaceae bacterium]|nr:peptidase M16 [Rikenellaceae bacterium]